MCDPRTNESEKKFGLLFDASECADYAECLARKVQALPDYSGGWEPDHPPVAIAVFRAFGATTYLIESNYFDGDFRSEFSVVNLTSFASVSPDVLRVHFFGTRAELAGDDGEPHLRDFVAANTKDYLGYTIIRPQQPMASIGRSVVGLPRGAGTLREGTSLQSRIRTPVIEHLTLFGVPLQAIGVPFMEQDANLLRCAHVVAWMAHFTAVLNGYVARRPSGSFNDIDGPVRLLGRAYPSPDISSWSLTYLLSNVNLPPEVVTGYRLSSRRELFWFDSPRLRQLIASAAEDVARPRSDDRVWTAVNTTATVCRYLNSGIPCIYNYPGHSVLVCGYYRARDLPDGDEDDSSVAGFIVMDDQGGPYRDLSIERITGDVLDDPDSVSVVIPLPVGLWLSGEAAELAGAKTFAQLVTEIASEVEVSDRPSTNDRDSSLAAIVAPALALEYAALARQLTGQEDCRYSIRSYATQGTDFKVEFDERLDHAASSRVIGYVTLPKYVWVVEVLDRDLRRDGVDAVIATIVVDGSASSFDNMRPPAPLLIHLPGLIRRAEGGEWEPSRASPYVSGRWAHKGMRSGTVAERQRLHHFKWAT